MRRRPFIPKKDDMTPTTIRLISGVQSSQPRRRDVRLRQRLSRGSDTAAGSLRADGHRDSKARLGEDTARTSCEAS